MKARQCNNPLERRDEQCKSATFYRWEEGYDNYHNASIYHSDFGPRMQQLQRFNDLLTRQCENHHEGAREQRLIQAGNNMNVKTQVGWCDAPAVRGLDVVAILMVKGVTRIIGTPLNLNLNWVYSLNATQEDTTTKLHHLMTIFEIQL